MSPSSAEAAGADVLVEEGVGNRNGLAEESSAVVAEVENQPFERRLVLGLQTVDGGAKLGPRILLEAVDAHHAVARREELRLGRVRADDIARHRNLKFHRLAFHGAGDIEFECHAGRATQERDRIVARLSRHRRPVDGVDAIAVVQACIHGGAALHDPLHQHAFGHHLHLDADAHILAVVVFLQALELLGVVEGAVGVELFHHATHRRTDEPLCGDLVHIAIQDHRVGRREDVQLSILSCGRSSRDGERARHAEDGTGKEAGCEVSVLVAELHGLEARVGGGCRHGGRRRGTLRRVPWNQRSGSMGRPSRRSSK